jgi:hypothetical protein
LAERKITSAFVQNHSRLDGDLEAWERKMAIEADRGALKCILVDRIYL